MGSAKIVVVRKLMPPAHERLAAAGELRCWEQEGIIPREILQEWIRGADALVAAPNVPVDEALLAGASRLKVVAQPAVGYDNIDVEACTRRGILVGNTPGVLVDTTADLAMGLLLSAARRIHEGWDFVRQGKWGAGQSLPLGMDLAGKTLGIVGMGQIGAAVARRAHAFGLRVVYHNRKRRDGDAEALGKYLSFEELLRDSDIIIALLPLSEKTRHFFDRDAFAQMKPTALFVNMARGGVVDTQALLEALRRERIACAALDVTDPEPLPVDHPLLQLPNLLVTPHIGSATKETRLRMAELTVDNVLAVLDNRPMPAGVNEPACKK